MSDEEHQIPSEYTHLGGPDSTVFHADEDAAHAPLLLPARKGATSAWILYDVANTVYAAMLTFLLMPYVTKLGELGTFSVLQSLSMILSGLAVPLMASIADRTGRAAIYLNIFTLLCVGAIAVFGFSPPLLMFGIAFMIANFTYNSALVFYNSLLPSVATPEREGLVSGLGVGLGYLGTLLTLAMILLLKDVLSTEELFLACAAAFFMLSLPVMFLVRDRRAFERSKFSWPLVGEQFVSLKNTLKSLGPNRNLRWFLLGNFLCVDVINAAIVVFVVYMFAVFAGQSVDIFGMNFDLALEIVPSRAEILIAGEDGMKVVLGAGLNVLALVAGVTLGMLADRWGALRAMRLSALALLLAIVGGIVFAGSGFSIEGRERLAQVTNEYKAVHDEGGAIDFAEAEAWWGSFAAQEEASLTPSEINEEDYRAPSLIVRRQASGNGSAFAFMLIVLGAFGLAGVWTAGRKVLLDLAPREKVGEYFGLYGITVKVSVFGTLLFGTLMSFTSPQVAIMSLLGLLVPGIACLMLVKPVAKDEIDA